MARQDRKPGVLQGTLDGREMKLYRLTAKGRKQLTVEEDRWQTVARAMARLLKPVK